MANITEHFGTKMKTTPSFVDVLCALDKLTNNSTKQISNIDYEEFCKEYVFEKIKGKSFGEAFCERFNFNDIFLKNLTDDTAKHHIEILGYIRK